MELTRSWPAHHRSQMAGLFKRGNVIVRLSAVPPAWDTWPVIAASLHAKTRKEQRGWRDEQMADRNKVNESAWKRNIISCGFQCKSTWAMCEMKAEALSAMCGRAPQMWDKYKSPKSRFFPVYIFSSYSFCNYLWFWEKRNPICYSEHLFTVYSSNTWCITRNSTFFVCFFSGCLSPFIDEF